MSTVTAVTMQDLELEHAELLPSRETLSCCCSHYSGSSFTQVGYGNTAQGGLVNVAVANGSFNNIASVGSGNIVGSHRPGSRRRPAAHCLRGMCSQEGVGPDPLPGGPLTGRAGRSRPS